MTEPIRTAGLTAVAVLLILGVGHVDYITGPDFGLSLFYILPIAYMGWRVGRTSAWVVAGVASACWIGADMMWRADDDVPLSIWNGFTRLAIFAFVATTMAAMRADRDRLRALLRDAERSARTDPLTGLANKRAFLERVDEEVTRARRAQSGVCLAYIDLDGFKTVNDTYGHAEGDTVLRRAAAALRDVVRDVDVMARLGGDEFAVLIVDAEPGGACLVAQRIVDRVRELAGEYPDTGLGASVGVVCCAAAPRDTETLIRAADGAMYRAKASGKGTVVVVGDRGQLA
jgi:diguanylate cyclase (GGDEF)-like protein